jgi:uncharacterized repeat protein (TIGR02543 family)
MSTKFRRLISKVLIPIFLITGLAVIPTTNAEAVGEDLTQTNLPATGIDPARPNDGRIPYKMYQLIAPTTGSWNFVGAWNFNNADLLTAPYYNRTCSGANNNTSSNNNTNTAGDDAQDLAQTNSANNSWIAGSVNLMFNALLGYGDNVTDLALKRRDSSNDVNNNNSGVDTGIKLSATITGVDSDPSGDLAGCMNNSQYSDYYGPQSGSIPTQRRTTETLEGVAFVVPEQYFAVSRKNGATWTNTFKGLDPNTKYRFQFISAAIRNIDEVITSSASLNGVAAEPVSESILQVSGAGGTHITRNRITVEVSGYDTYSLIRRYTGVSESWNSMVLNAFTIYEGAKTATTISQSVSNANPAAGRPITLSATVSPTATGGTVTFKDSTGNNLCTTGTLSSSTASCTYTNNSAGTKTISAIYSGSPSYATSTTLTTTDVTWIEPFVTTYDATTNGGTALSQLTANFEAGDDALTLPAPSVRTGFTASGWYTTASTGGSKVGDAGASYTPTGTSTLYFRWTANAYTATYNANTGSGTMSTQAFNAGTPFSLSENSYTKANYVFDGWYTNSGGTGTRYNAGQSVTLYANQTYYAKWIVAARYITYAANGGSGTVPTESSKVTGDTFTVADGTGLTRTGYSFADWTDGSNTVVAGSTYTVPSGNVTLTAQWTAQVYTITYNSNNASSGASSRTSDSFTYGGSGIALPTVGTLVRTGYTFGGWSATADGSALTGNYTPTQSVTLYARWSANTYTTTYNTNGGSGSAPANSSYTAGGAEFALPDGSGLTKSGYDFAGWSTTTTGSALSGTQTNTADQILYARWTIKSITATYAKGTASASTFTTFPTSASGNYGTTITLDSTVDASVSILGTTYIFQGWSDGTSTYQKGDSYLLGASNVTLTAQWVAIYGVRYSLNGGTAAAGDFAYDVECTVGDNYCTNGQAITSNSTPTRTGYTFTGWKDQSDNSIAQATSFTVSGTSYLLYAQWSVISRSVTYALSGGSGSTPTESNKTINQGFTISASSPTKSGYNFTGWSDGTLVYGPSANYVVGSANVTLTAQWSAISYTVTYDTNRGTSTTPTQAAQTIGQTFSVAAIPTRAGYTFGKWNDGTNNYDPAATYTMPAANVVLTATWSTTSLTITYSVNGGSSTLPTESNKTIGNTFVLAEAATRANRTFLGWSDGTTTYGAGATYTVGGANVTLTAQWSGTLFSVTYASGGATSGSVPTEVDKEVGTYVTLKAHTLNNLAKTASTFAGWSDGRVVYQAGESYLMSSTAVTLTATWSRNTYTVTYALGGGSGTLPTQADVNSGGSFTIASDSGLTKSNATFAGWSDGTTTRQVGATYSNIATDVTLTAIWSENASSGGSYDPAPNWSRDQVSNNPSQISIQVEKNNGLNKVSWSSSQPVNIIVTNFNGSKKVYENLLTAIDLPNPKPGESAEVIITSGSDQSLVYDRKTIYEAPLPVQSLEVKQVASRTLYATWKPASTIQSYKIVITPAVGAPIVIETKDPQFKIQTAPNLKFVFEVIAVGAGELESNAINKTAFVSKGKVVTSLLSINQPKSSKLLQSSSADKLTTFAATLEPVSSVLCTGAATSKAGISSALAAASKVCAQLQKANPEVYVKSISKIAPVSSNSKLKSNYVVDISIVIKPIT